MAKIVKMCELSGGISARLFQMLNFGKVTIKEWEPFGTVIVTDTEPMKLTYPEGWYYKDGFYRGSNTSTEIMMVKSNHALWQDFAKYSILD